MKIILTQRVTALRNFLLLLISTLPIAACAEDARHEASSSDARLEIRSKMNEKNEVQSVERDHSENEFATSNKILSDVDADKASQKKLGRKIQILQLDPVLFQFQFPRFSYFWLTSEADFNQFWKSNSRISGNAPKLNIDWRTESLLAVFWESKNAVVRIPGLMNVTETETDGLKEMNFNLLLNTPCFGIITRSSPAMFLLVDKNYADVDSIVLSTETTKSTGCY